MTTLNSGYPNTSIGQRLIGASIALVLLSACGGGSPAPSTTAAATTDPAAATVAAEAPPADLNAAATEASQTLAANATTWTPEALEDLLSPVALYPDPVLAQLLIAATNPQEVLDAGNWLIANPDLTGKPLEVAAEKAGFTVPMRSLMQFPEAVDKLCLNMLWTEELGQAYVNDQQGVMDAVQRLRKQAKDVGNLQSSPQMKVETQQAAGQAEVIALSPPSPEVVYVPTYDPQAVYAPAPAVAATPATTTTTTTTASTGHSTGSLVATGLLAFGAGMLVNEVFDDDDDYYHGGYYNNMWSHPMPYYPPYPYRPSYGSGFYPGNSYHRPPTYIRGGNTVVINQNNDYHNRYNNSQNIANSRNKPRSPITSAKPNRPDLQQLNTKAAQGPARRAPPASDALKGKGGYAGNDPNVRRSLDNQASKAQKSQDGRSKAAVQGSYAGAAKDRPVAAGSGARPTPNVGGKAPAPKVQGSYAGAKPDRPKPATQAARPAAKAPNRDAARPAAASAPKINKPDGDRGRASTPRPNASPAAQAQNRPKPANQPQAANHPKPQAQPKKNNSAMSRPSGSGASTQAASQRGKQSMPAGAKHGGGKKR
ncbi:MAG: hypothetical protein RL030_414 [Pseudomonadota bacterium]